MEPSDLTIEILKSIRDEIKATRTDLSERIDHTNERLDRMVEEQIRQATAIVDLQGAVVDLQGAMVALHDGQKDLYSSQGLIIDELRTLNGRIDHVLTGPLGGLVRDHEERLSSLESRLTAVEQRNEP